MTGMRRVATLTLGRGDLSGDSAAVWCVRAHRRRPSDGWRPQRQRCSGDGCRTLCAALCLQVRAPFLSSASDKVVSAAYGTETRDVISFYPYRDLLSSFAALPSCLVRRFFLTSGVCSRGCHRPLPRTCTPSAAKRRRKSSGLFWTPRGHSLLRPRPQHPPLRHCPPPRLRQRQSLVPVPVPVSVQLQVLRMLRRSRGRLWQPLRSPRPAQTVTKMTMTLKRR